MDDEKFMARALQLAKLGQGFVSPNPLVGCVIVHDNRIIGEGWHRRFGEAHAEVNAVNSAADQEMLRESTVYVTLEPCAHFGKTPPCAEMLVRRKVKRVVVSVLDPNPLVAGKGIALLKDAGIPVTMGVLEDEGRMVNARFLTFFEETRPYVILKWAATADGFIARENFDSKWISGEWSRMLVHRWRSEEDAILVGSNTALKDDPRLTVRDWSGRNPVRVVFDRNLKIGRGQNIFDGSAKTICYNLQRDAQEENILFVRLTAEDFIRSALRDLHARGIQSLIVEGGSQVLNAFLKKDLWDEARVFTSPTRFGKGIAAPVINAAPESEEMLEADTLRIYRRKAGI